MDFELSADQRDLRDAAARLLDGHASSARVRAFVGPADGTPGDDGLDGDLWSAMAEQGWLAVEAAETEGGLGLGMVEVCVLGEQLGGHAAPVPFSGSSLARHALRAASEDSCVSAAARNAATGWLARLTTGDAIGCVAWASDAGRTEAVDEPDGSCRLTAEPEPTPFAAVADVAVVLTPDAVFAVGLGAARRPPAEPSMDRTRPLAWLKLVGADAFRLGGPDLAAALLDRVATASAADLLGASSRALEMSVAYAKDRHQFGKPIGSFQAVKHRLADALVDAEAMRSAVYHAAWSIDVADPAASLAASAAKAWCSDAAARVMATALQVHGGIGFTWEHDLHFFVKRSQLDRSSFGDAAFHRERVASMLEGWRPTDPSLF